jgi:hypothetical protein
MWRSQYSLTRRLAVALLAIATMACGCTKKAPAPAPVEAAKSQPGFRVMCAAKAIDVSPYIYGIAFDVSGHSNWRDESQWKLNPSGRRFGGNAATRYNYEHGTAFNRASDWYFENDGDEQAKEPTYVTFLKGNATHKALSALQLPLIGWVAKDITSSGFPTDLVAGQKLVDERRKAGKGLLYSGREAEPLPPTQTSVAAEPVKVAEYVARIRKEAQGKRVYILDNEPALWHVTHRDVHPQPLSYDELVERTIKYAAAIRAADPEALIAGPAAYGWNELFFSPQDLASPAKTHRDRAAHGDDPLIVHYLKRLHEHQAKTGVRLLDLLDVHFYPQGENLGVGLEGGATPEAAAMRKRSPRALWDPDYVDESWINEPIKLLPRLQGWIAAHYPGVKLQIGEWNLGAERDVSSGLAVAETLGQFARNNVYSAFYWTFPLEGTAAAMGFRAFRNFDGKGGQFESTLVPAESEPGTSLFVSRDPLGKHYVAVTINFDPKAEHSGTLDVGACGQVKAIEQYVYTNGAKEFARTSVSGEPNRVVLRLPKESITVFDVTMQ